MQALGIHLDMQDGDGTHPETSAAKLSKHVKMMTARTSCGFFPPTLIIATYGMQRATDFTREICQRGPASCGCGTRFIRLSPSSRRRRPGARDISQSSGDDVVHRKEPIASVLLASSCSRLDVVVVVVAVVAVVVVLADASSISRARPAFVHRRACLRLPLSTSRPSALGR